MSRSWPIPRRLFSRSAGRRACHRARGLRFDVLEARLALTVLPAGFSESLVTSAENLVRPTAMEFSPTGELWVLEQDGAAKVVDVSTGETSLAGTLAVQSAGERGLLGIAFDSTYDGPGANPDHVYLYYTVATPIIHNRVSRFAVNHAGSSPTLETETIIMEIAPEPQGDGSSNHNGGAMHFGTDGKLYVAVGDLNADGVNFLGGAHVSQRLDSQHGKMLRIDVSGDDFPADANRNYAIPPDNPFIDQDPLTFDEIWALGLRNPYTFAVQRETGRILINDVGETQWEEINDGFAGKNYGWASEQTLGGFAEGFEETAPNYVTVGTYADPLMAYDHSSSAPTPAGCAVTGGVFYPAAGQFGNEYAGKYFFADVCGNFIRIFDPNAPGSLAAPDTSLEFATNLTTSGPVDLKVDAEGNLYYLARGGSGNIYRISLDEPAVALDFGDAPSDYPVTLAGDGARHAITNLFLGASVDAQDNGVPSQNADGDSDDDGATLIATILSTAVPTTSSVSFVSSGDGKIDGWIDFNQDGDWQDEGEQVLSSVSVTAGHNLTSFSVPAEAPAGTTAARFRLSTAGGLAPTGAAADGEVEDYLVTVVSGSSSPIVRIDLPAGTSDVTVDGDELVVKQGDSILLSAPLAQIGMLELVGSPLDDVLTFTAFEAIATAMASFDGGPGKDFLKLLVTDQVFNLVDTTGPLSNIEAIDIVGTGDNQLTVSIDSVKAASSTTDILEVIADAGDIVRFSDAVEWQILTPKFMDGQFTHLIAEASAGGTAALHLRNDRLLQNPLNRFDADRNGAIQPLDALRIINELRRRGSGPIALPSNDSEISHLYFDVSGDNQFSPLDALRVINALSRIHRGGTAEGEAAQPLTDLDQFEIDETPMRPVEDLTSLDPFEPTSKADGLISDPLQRLATQTRISMIDAMWAQYSTDQDLADDALELTSRLAPLSASSASPRF
ncbi:MAG: PQQ-dependent sugar dehydrogenase [Planctomycetaceae bacterium]